MSDLEGYEARIAELQRELDAAVPASAPVPEPAPAPEPEPDSMPAPLEQLTQEDSEAPAAMSEQCRVASDLRDRICDLSTRICEIAERDPSAADTMLKCERARDACIDARTRIASECR